MKKAIFLSIALFAGVALFAQAPSKPVKATKGNAIAPVSTATGPSMGGATTGGGGGLAACTIGKTWKLVKVEKFGVEKDPGDDQKNDMLQLNSDGTFKVILKGVEKTGTYTRGTWLTLKPNDGSESMPYKIMSCEGSNMKADWRDGDTHNIFTYTAQ